MRRWLLLIFLATIAVDWPQLPFNMRAADALFIAAAVAILRAARSWTRPRLQFLDVALLLYLAGSVMAVAFSPDPRAGAVELIRHAYVAAIYGVIAIAVGQGLAPAVGTGLALSGGLLAVLSLGAAVVQMATGLGFEALTPVMTLPYIGDTVRLRALTTSAAMFACVLAVSAPFGLAHPAIARRPGRTVATAFVFGAAAAWTFSHSIAGVAVAVVVVSWRALPTRLARATAVAAAIVVVLAFNFAATIAVRSIGATPFRDDTVFHYGVDRGRAEIAGVSVEYQTMSYLRIKQVAWEAFTSRPLFGIGLDRFHSITEAAYQQGRLTLPYRAIDPHSTFFGRLAETGLAGGLTLLVLWIAIGRSAAMLWSRRREHQWLAAAAVAAIAGTLVNTMNADVMNFRFLWVVLGLVRGLSSTASTPSS